MSETLVNVAVGVGSAVIAGAGILLRTGRKQAEMELCVEEALKESKEVRSLCGDCMERRLPPLEAHRILADERMSRLHQDLSEIKAMLKDLADRLTPR